MAELTNKPSNEIFIQDLLAIDTSVPVNVTGGLAGEFSLEQAVGIASMVKSDRLQMAMIASEIKQKLHVDGKRRRKRRWRSEILPCHPAPTQ